MGGVLVTIRDRVFEKINDKKIGGQFAFNNFELIKTYFPWQTLQELGATPNGRVYIIGLAFDTDRPKTRTTAGSVNEIPIQVAFQKLIKDPQDVEEIDKVVDFVEELQTACRLAVVTEDDEDSPYQWLRNESLKDENETAFAYMAMREANIFEAYFSAFYNNILT